MSQDIPERFFQSSLNGSYPYLLLPTGIPKAQVLDIEKVGERAGLHGSGKSESLNQKLEKTERKIIKSIK
jgi:hypothetical protein